MPVDTPHPNYSANESKWRRCRDAVDGADAIKGKKTEYLPRLSAQDDAEYNAYLMRAMWYGASARTIQGLSGAVMRKDPVVTLPEGLMIYLKDVTKSGVSFTSFAKLAIDEVLKTGRFGVLVDMPAEATEQQLPYFAPYTAESIVNWATESRNGIQVLLLVVLKECVWEKKPDDLYEMQAVEQYRVLRLVDGVYQAETFRKLRDDWTSMGVTVPTQRGKPLDYIPFCFFGPHTVTPEIEKPPILDLVEVNLSHYRSSADLEHGRHFCGLPTPWVAGFPTDKELKIGSSIAWVSSDPNASAGMLEFTGQGLGALEKALETKENMMAVLGARLLEQAKPSVEASETIKTRLAGEQSELKSTANTVSAGLSRCLQWAAAWAGMSLEEGQKTIEAQLNTDFFDEKMSFAELTQLVAALQQGAMSWKTYYYNIERGEISRPGVTAEQELEEIQAQMPTTIPQGEDPTEEDELNDPQKREPVSA